MSDTHTRPMPFTTRRTAPGPPLTPPEEGDSGLAGEQCDFMMMRHYISNDGGDPLSSGEGWGEAPYAAHDAERASHGGEYGD